jgi:two-component system chemotaxis response regulator CheB
MPSQSVDGHDIVVIGASAGGVEPLLGIAQSLPADLSASLFVVLHSDAGSMGVLPNLLGRAGALETRYAIHGECIEAGRILVAPPDYHLLVKKGHVAVVRAPKENRFRPAIDSLFRTAARAYGPRVVGVILSGTLEDGTHGLSVIKSFGGKAIVQDPEEAQMPGMPASACRHVEVDYVVPSAEIASLLARLSREAPERAGRAEGIAMDPDDDLEPDIAERGSDALASHLDKNPPSPFVCPECGGALWEISREPPSRFRCHVGHSFTGDGLLAEQDRDLEVALWSAVRALDKNAALNRAMAERAEKARLEGLMLGYRRRAESAQSQANVIRDLLVSPAQGSVQSAFVKNQGELPSLADKPTKQKPRNQSHSP